MTGRYPSDDELATIRNWDARRTTDLFEFVRSIWNWPDWATKEGGMYRLATGGWSGNEDIIAAINENHIVYLMCWQRSERGGLHWYKPAPDGIGQTALAADEGSEK